MTTVCTCVRVCFLLGNNARAVRVDAVMRLWLPCCFERLSIWYDADLCHLHMQQVHGQTDQRLARRLPPADSGFPLSTGQTLRGQSALSINKVQLMSCDFLHEALETQITQNHYLHAVNMKCS